jgi:hypothetical protein
MSELDIFVEWVSCAAELENRRIRRKQSLSICWLGYEIPESVSFCGSRERIAENMEGEEEGKIMPSSRKPQQPGLYDASRADSVVDWA